MGNITHRLVIQPLWNVVKQIRDEVGNIVESRGQEVSYASQMTASELVENAVKYGLAIDYAADRGIEFELNADEDTISIAVTNRVASGIDLGNVTRHIDAINAAEDPQTLYVERLMELMDKPGKGGSQLGLYRIAYEGGFNLSYKVVDDAIITVKASRKIVI